MKKLIRSIAIIAIFAICISLCACKNNNSDLENTSYSVGLQDTGYYINWEKYEIVAPDFSQFKVNSEEILTWCVDYADSENIKNVDDYIYAYANEFLIAIGAADKEMVEDGDNVTVNLTFTVDGQVLSEYQTENTTYTSSVTGDSIVSSFNGHKKGEKYDVQYKFPEEDQYYPSKEATVSVEILDVTYADPMKHNLVEPNLEEIQKYVKGATDKDSFLTCLRPLVAEAMLPNYMQDTIQLGDGLNAPQEFVEYELTRMKVRLNRLGYTYEHYLTEAKTTDSEVRLYCSMIAQENCIYLSYYDKMDIEITDEMLKDAYGENYQFILDTQGIGYMKLDMIRSLALDAICQEVNLTDRVVTEETTNDAESENPDTTEPTNNAVTEDQESTQPTE